MKYFLGQIVTVHDNFVGKKVSTKEGVIERIDENCKTPFPILVRFSCGGSGWYNSTHLSNL